LAGEDDLGVVHVPSLLDPLLPDSRQKATERLCLAVHNWMRARDRYHRAPLKKNDLPYIRLQRALLELEQAYAQFEASLA
jgi:hypothetical protein